MIHSSSKKEPALEGWTTQPFPEAARALRARSATIVELWMTAVLKILPAAENLTLAQLRDHVPSILDQMIAALESGKAEEEARLENISRPHGDLRFHQEYNANEVMIEYGLLRRILLREVADELHRTLSDDELAAINLDLDTAQRRGVVAFVDHLGTQVRTSDELQSSYISHLNHDLRGGMNGILLMVEVLKRELAAYPQLAEASEDLDAMRRSVLESVATMDKFVYAHKLGRGKLQARFVTIDLSLMLKDLVSAFEHAASERKVVVDLDVIDGCRLDSDKDMVRLILFNLLSNAVKYSRRGGGRVHITASPRVGGGCDVEIKDDGAGIPPEQLSTITTVAPPGKAGRGIKLGLPVSKMAADLLGATLSIDSTPGEGTMVRVEIPDHGVGNPR